MPDLPGLSIIIPVLNEARALPTLVKQLQAQVGVELEIIIADGGSTDRSVALARELGVRIVACPKGRPRQLNLGASAAGHEDLLLLHADSQLPSDSLLVDAVHAWHDRQGALHTQRVAGQFRLMFDRSGRKHRMAFRYLEEKSASNRLQTINGDQGTLIGKRFLEELGGFDESMPIMEDQRIAHKIVDAGHWLLLPGTLHTSGRRFETEGFHRRYILLSLMMGLYWTGTHQFFVRARDVYADHGDARKLQLWPFFRILWIMTTRDYEPREALHQWYKVGTYVRENSWQLFFFLDVGLRRWLGEGRYPFTRFNDRVFFPLTNNAVCNGINTVLVFVWYMLVLAPVFFVLDRLGPRR
jgi:rSAM/selenodomain-associated transferase 2